MRALRILPLLLVAMTVQAAAQSIADATKAIAPAVRDDGRVLQPSDGQVCGPWLQTCPNQDRDRVLLFLSVMGGGKRPLILR